MNSTSKKKKNLKINKCILKSKINLIDVLQKVQSHISRSQMDLAICKSPKCPSNCPEHTSNHISNTLTTQNI